MSTVYKMEGVELCQNLLMTVFNQFVPTSKVIINKTSDLRMSHADEVSPLQFEPRATGQPKSSAHKRTQHSQELKIPLISKRMNNVEKYISNFGGKTEDMNNRRKTNEEQKDYKSPFRSDRDDYIQDYCSVNLFEASRRREEPQVVENKCCVEYSSITKQKSEERIETLSKLQKDYIRLKEKLLPQKQSLPTISRMVVGKMPNRSDGQKISPEQVEKEIKQAIINENGKKYYADLYLLKKNRDSIISSLAKVGSNQRKSNERKELSYQEKLHANQHQFVKTKILQEREVKKTKMIKGRNLHWNVYYDMLALSSTGKRKLKQVCRFPTTFGIV